MYWIYGVMAAVVVGIVASVLVSASLHAKRYAKKLTSAPLVKIASLVEDARVRVVGTARSDAPPVKAPFTSTECIAFRASQRAKMPGDNGSTFTPPPVQEILAFRVDDGTGTVDVEVDRVELALVPSTLTSEQVTGKVFGAKLIGRNTTESSFTEYRLVANERVAVIGFVQRGPDGALQLTATPDQPVIISNDPTAFA